MEINSTFKVIARCKQVKRDNDAPDLYADYIDIELEFNINIARALLFKFTGDFVKIGDYDCGIKYNDVHELIGIVLIDNDYFYVVKNHQQIFNQVHDGYIRLCMIDKLVDILEFDFKAGLDFLDPPEEEKFE